MTEITLTDSRKMSSEDIGQPEAGSAPFDKRCSADVIFRTSDNVNFYLHKIVLSLSSTFFEDMFSLSQPPGATSSASDELPVVEVTEDSLTLDHLLRYCYPVRNPVIKSLEVLDLVLGAAIKYTLEAAIEFLTEALRALVKENPLQAFTVSCRHRCEDEARLAAEAWRKVGEDSEWSDNATTFGQTYAARCYTPEMENLPAGIYFRLIRFVASGKDEEKGTHIKFCDPPNTAESDAGEAEDAGDTEYPFNQPRADLILRSVDGVDFKIHRVIIEMQITANPVFPLQSILLSAPLPDTNVDGLPVIQTRETSSTLRILLQSCYPGTPSNNILLWDAESCCAPKTINAIGAAQRYGMSNVVESYRVALWQNFSEIPLAVFCIENSMGWYGNAEVSAQWLAESEWLPVAYHRALELLSAGEYRRLLEFWYTYQERFCDIAEQLSNTKGTRWRTGRWVRYDGRPTHAIPSPLVEAEVYRASTLR